MLAKYAADELLKRFDHLETGRIRLSTPDGRQREFEGKMPGRVVDLDIKDWRVISNVARYGNIGLAQDYKDGKWDSSDLSGLVQLGIENKVALKGFILGSSFFRKLSSLSYLLRLNTINGSRKNIQAHYDLGNDFYKLWLDPSMTYSSALYRTGNETLEQAQHNKYDRILDQLNTNSGSILEIGCGWGGFAARAMGRGDFAIRGLTLSEQQKAYADQRQIANAHIVLEDYRIQKGKFDNIVSIEMFEAVGEKFWPQYFSQIRTQLKSSGRAVVQTITINDNDFQNYRAGGDFIRSFIFPGGLLPSPSTFRVAARASGLRPQNEFYFGQDYARTLEEWLGNFEAKSNEIKNLGYDAGFIRLWRLYLAACAGAFRAGKINVMQVELVHA
jgi:cyclopropane-fatty-acyl-phospholipid synthase